MQVLRRYETPPGGARRARLPRCAPLVVPLVLGLVMAGCGGAEPDVAAPAATTTVVVDTTDPSAATTITGPTTTGAGSATTLTGPQPSATTRPSTVVPPPTTATTRPKPTTTVTTDDPNGGLGAPFDIPAIVISEGFSKPEAHEAAKNAFDQACGADPCRVTFVDVDPRPDPAMAHCEIVFTGYTSPAAGTTIRGARRGRFLVA